MKERFKPKIYAREELYYIENHRRKKAGYIQLVCYYTKETTPHIEYAITEDRFKNKGIMSKELPKYLKKLSKFNKQMIAVVESDNVYSIKLLIDNGFIFFSKIGLYKTYIIDFRISKEITKHIISKEKNDLIREKLEDK